MPRACRSGSGRPCPPRSDRYESTPQSPVRRNPAAPASAGPRAAAPALTARWVRQRYVQAHQTEKADGCRRHFPGLLDEVLTHHPVRYVVLRRTCRSCAAFARAAAQLPGNPPDPAHPALFSLVQAQPGASRVLLPQTAAAHKQAHFPAAWLRAQVCPYARCAAYCRLP